MWGPQQKDESAPQEYYSIKKTSRIALSNPEIKVSTNLKKKGVFKIISGELSRALIPTFPARSRLSKIHGGSWRIDEFPAVIL